VNDIAEWTLKCDQPSCGSIIIVRKSTDGAAIEVALRRARREGWLVEGGFHLCPDHARVH